MSDTHELWREIEIVEGKYSVSNHGRVKNNQTGHILRPGSHHGYPQVNLHYGSKSYTKSIHRLVAMAFIPNSENKPEVNHKNGVRDDNRVENLEWVTSAENLQHAIDNHLMEKGLARMSEPGWEPRRKRDRKAVLKRSDAMTEEQYNCLEDKAKANGTTIYGLYKEQEQTISELRKQLDNTTQSEFLVKCLKHENKALAKRVNQMEQVINEKPKTYSIGLESSKFAIGQRYNYLTIIGYARDNDKRVRPICKCDCGNIRMVHQFQLENGKVKSCGCMHDELARQNNPLAPRKQTRIYETWNRLHRTEFWCDEWQGFDKFYEWSINNGYKKGAKLHRYDTDMDFSPTNCHWGALKDYKPKSRRKRYICFGEKLTLNEMAGKYGILAPTLSYRMKQGVTPEQAVTIPMKRTGVESNSLGVYYANNER